MAWYPVIFNNGGGGGSEFERLCYIEYVMRDTPEIPTIDTIDTSADYADYLSYDSTTKKFTVLQAFTAIITAWVENVQNAGSRAQGEFYLNGVKSLGTFVVSDGSAGAKAGETHIFALEQGDTFYSYTPSSNGWPAQRLKVYKTETMPVSDLYSFTDENSG